MYGTLRNQNPAPAPAPASQISKAHLTLPSSYLLLVRTWVASRFSHVIQITWFIFTFLIFRLGRKFKASKISERVPIDLIRVLSPRFPDMDIQEKMHLRLTVQPQILQACEQQSRGSQTCSCIAVLQIWKGTGGCCSPWDLHA